MAKKPTQIRIDEETKEKATELFADLGMDMSEAVNIFLHQCIMQNGLPFKVEKPMFSEETLQAMEEARKIAKDPRVPGYTNMEELEKALES